MSERARQDERRIMLYLAAMALPMLVIMAAIEIIY